MPYFISLLNYVQRITENKSMNKISTDQILINVIIFLFCEDKNSVIKYYHFLYVIFYNCCSIFYLLLFSCSFVSDFLWPYGLQHARLPCPSLSPGACSNSCPLSWWCHPTLSSCHPFLLLFSEVRESIVWILKLLFEWQLQSCKERIRPCVPPCWVRSSTHRGIPVESKTFLTYWG